MPILTQNTSIDTLKKSLCNAWRQSCDSRTHDIFDLRFGKTAILPYPESDTSGKQNEINFVEFLNQFFTTLATVISLEKIFANPQKWKVCIGEKSGRDIITDNAIAEVFAVTTPNSNDKFKDEIFSLFEPKPEDPEEKEIKARYIIFILAEKAFQELGKKPSWMSYQSKDYSKTFSPVSWKKTDFQSGLCSWNCQAEDKGIVKGNIKVYCISEKYAKNYLKKMLNLFPPNKNTALKSAMD